MSYSQCINCINILGWLIVQPFFFNPQRLRIATSNVLSDSHHEFSDQLFSVHRLLLFALVQWSDNENYNYPQTLHKPIYCSEYIWILLLTCIGPVYKRPNLYTIMTNLKMFQIKEDHTTEIILESYSSTPHPYSPIGSINKGEESSHYTNFQKTWTEIYYSRI